MKKTYLLSLYFVILYYYAEAQDPTVVLRQGRVVGTRIFTTNSPLPIETYFGIPYATAPVGRHRFAAPERHPGWRRTLYARRPPPRCPQYDDREPDGYFNEDCLFLNICTPRRADEKSLPVVVILYSHSWSHKGPPNLPCQELAAEGIVVVTVTYRLHLLGFFTLKSRSSRGNLALLDQYMALMWIRENIAGFGGDPGLITLLGHSAGADSILYHMASPRTNGLFQRAIIMSPRDIWQAINSVESSSNKVEESSREAAQSVGCNGDADAILQCMQSRPLDDIMKFYTPSNKTMTLRPVAENFLSPSEQYLPLDLYHALVSDSKSPQIDVLFGTADLDAINNDEVDYNDLRSKGTTAVLEYATYQLIPRLLRLHDLDGSPIISTLYPICRSSYKHTDGEVTFVKLSDDLLVPARSAQWIRTATYSNLTVLVEAVLWEYWGSRGQRVDQDAFEAVEVLARMKTSAEWGTGAALLAAKLARRVTRLYIYKYAQPGQVDLQGRPLNYTGAVHGSDFIALLGEGMVQQLARRRPSSSEQRTSAYIRKYFVHFIKFGYPTSTDEWPQYRVGAAYLHDLHGDAINSNKMNSAGRDVAFWLQYLPYINRLHSTTERTESLNSNQEDTKLRGAVYALVGVATALLALLGLGAALLRREKRQQRSGMDE